MLPELLNIIALSAILDIFWVFGSGLYSGYITGNLEPWTIALLWSVVLVAQGLLLYILTKDHQQWPIRALLGALQGFTVYSVFNITAKVVFPSSMWPTYIALMDTVWGTLLFATVAAATTNGGFDPSHLHPAYLRPTSGFV